MLGPSTKIKLAHLIQAIAISELRGEVVRQVLAEKDIFEPFAAFRRISYGGNVYITGVELQEFLVTNSVDVSFEEACMLVQIFNTNQDGKLLFTEFLNAILPRADATLRQAVTLRPTYELEHDEKLPYDVEYSISRVFEEELHNAQAIYQLKAELIQCSDFSVKDAFRALDFCQKTFLTAEDFSMFMEDIGEPLDNNELKALFRRIDLDLDSKITYVEFVEAFFTSDANLARPSNRSPASSVRESTTRKTKHSPIHGPSITKKERLLQNDSTYNRHLNQTLTFKSTIPSPIVEQNFQTPKKQSTNTKIIYFEEHLSTERLTEHSSVQVKSPIKIDEEQELVKALKDMINNSHTIEKLRKSLALRPDFNLFDAFRYFDKDGGGEYMNLKQFEEGCKRLLISPAKDELFLFFRKLDANYDGYIRFTDVSALLSPKDKQFDEVLDKRISHSIDAEIFTPETEQLLTKVLQTAINHEVHAETLRQKLSKRPTFNLYDAFRALDKYNRNYITIDDFKEILHDYGIFASSTDLDSLVERFKGYQNGSGKISYSEFVHEMTPKSMRLY